MIAVILSRRLIKRFPVSFLSLQDIVIIQEILISKLVMILSNREQTKK